MQRRVKPSVHQVQYTPSSPELQDCLKTCSFQYHISLLSLIFRPESVAAMASLLRTAWLCSPFGFPLTSRSAFFLYCSLQIDCQSYGVTAGRRFNSCFEFTGGGQLFVRIHFGSFTFFSLPRSKEYHLSSHIHLELTFQLLP